MFSGENSLPMAPLARWRDYAFLGASKHRQEQPQMFRCAQHDSAYFGANARVVGDADLSQFFAIPAAPSLLWKSDLAHCPTQGINLRAILIDSPPVFPYSEDLARCCA
jgi:hypothetical protein